MGVLVFLPFVHRFARAIERALPDRGPALTRYLDNTLLRTPAVALEATRRALAETAAETFGILRGSISLNGDGKDEARGTAARIALDRLKEFFSQIPPIAEDEPMSQLRVGQMHAIDHLTRLQSRLSPPSSVRHVLGHPRLQPAVELTSAILTQGETGMRRQVRTDWLSSVERSASELGDLRRKERPLILQQSVGADSPAQTLELLDAMRWLDRLGYHTWRICHYLGNGAAQELSLVDAHTDPEDYVDQ